jgi:hypothetical protein
MNRVLTSLIHRIQEAKPSLFKIPDTARNVDSGWFVGMAISPTEFSQQLGRLQVSLQGEVTHELAPKMAAR